MKWKEWKELAEKADLWTHHVERGLLKAEHIRGYILRLWFEEEMDISIYELDFYPLIVEENPGEVLLNLRDENLFRLVKGNYVLIWPNPETGAYDEKAIDIAPECVRFFCEKYGRKVKAAHKTSPALKH